MNESTLRNPHARKKLQAKAEARFRRAQRRAKASARPKLVGVSKKVIKSQRYLAKIGSPHSERVAAVAV